LLSYTVPAFATRTTRLQQAQQDDAQEVTTAPPTSSASRRPIERGVSVDQDGKSNVWAIEPKEEVQSKSAEEKARAGLFAAGGLGAAAAAAAVVLTNLPDPSQF
jgi:hypothetical protein